MNQTRSDVAMCTIALLDVSHEPETEQARLNILQAASKAVCTVCRKRFTKGTRHLTAGQIGLCHECGTGHRVEVSE